VPKARKRAHGVFSGETAGRVGQVGEAWGSRWSTRRSEPLSATFSAAQGDGHDLGAGGFSGGGILRVAGVLARADDEARGVGLAGDDEFVAA